MTILLNQDLSALRYPLAWQILDRFLTAQPKDWVGEAKARQLTASSSETNRPAKAKKAMPSQPLSNYAGLYDSPAFGQIVVRVENGALHARYFDDESALTPVGGDLFEATTRDPVNIWFGGERAQFVTDLSGHIETLRVELDPSADIRMEFTKQTSH